MAPSRKAKPASRSGDIILSVDGEIVAGEDSKICESKVVSMVKDSPNELDEV